MSGSFFVCLILVVNVTQAVTCAVFRKIESLKTLKASVHVNVGNYIGSRYATECILFKRKVNLGVVLLLRVNVHGLEAVVNELDVLLSAVVLIRKIVRNELTLFEIGQLVRVVLLRHAHVRIGRRGGSGFPVLLTAVGARGEQGGGRQHQ